MNRITKEKQALEQTRKKELSISKQPCKLLRTEPLKVNGSYNALNRTEQKHIKQELNERRKKQEKKKKTATGN